MSYESEQLPSLPIFVFSQIPEPIVLALDETVTRISSENFRNEIVVSQPHVRVETNVFIPYITIFL